MWKSLKIFSDKNIRCLVLAILPMLSLTNCASAQTETYQTFVERTVSQIRTEVNAINKNAAKYTKTTKSVEGIALERAEVTYYFSNKTLKKITAQMFGETYNQTSEFYYENDKLIFAFVKRNQYDVQKETDAPPNVLSMEERRFYFAFDQDLIRLLVGEIELKSGAERYAELKDEIVETTEKLKNAYGNYSARLAGKRQIKINAKSWRNSGSKEVCWHFPPGAIRYSPPFRWTTAG